MKSVSTSYVPPAPNCDCTSLYDILMADDAAQITSRVINSSEVLLEIQEEALAPLYALLKQAGQLRRGMTLQLLVDWLNRVVSSFFMNPAEFLQDGKQFKRYLQMFVIPSVIEPSPNT